MFHPYPQQARPDQSALVSWTSVASAGFAVVVSVVLFLRFLFLPLGAFGKISEIDYDGVWAVRTALSSLALLPLVPVPLFIGIGIRGPSGGARFVVGLIVCVVAGLVASAELLHAVIG